MSVDNRTLLKEANKHLPGANIVMDLYDSSIVGITKNVADIFGYSMNDFDAYSVNELFNINDGKGREVITEDMMREKGERTVRLINKKGEKIKLTAKFQTLDYQGCMYQAVKVLDYTKK